MKKVMNRGERVQRKPNAAPGPPSIKCAVVADAPVPAVVKKLSSHPYARVDASAVVHRQQDDFKAISQRTIILILLIILLIGTLPAWPYSGGWGYYPSGGVGLVVIIVLIFVLMGRI